MIHRILVFLCVTVLLSITGVSQDSIPLKKKRLEKSFLIDNRPFTYEIPLWIPGFRGEFAFGDVNISGGDGEDPGDPGDPDDDGDVGLLGRIFTPKFYLKFFYLTRIAYENKNFLVQLDGLTGSVGKSVKFNYNNSDIVKLELTTINIRLLAGYRIIDTWSHSRNFRYELYLYIGARYHNHDIRTWFLDNKKIFDIQPGWFEPILGVQNQFSWRRWCFLLNADIGGFFIDSKYSFQLTSFAYYRMGRALSLKFGWNLLSMNHETTHFGKDLVIKMMLNGPTVGLAIQF